MSLSWGSCLQIRICHRNLTLKHCLIYFITVEVRFLGWFSKLLVSGGLKLSWRYKGAVIQLASWVRHNTAHCVDTHEQRDTKEWRSCCGEHVDNWLHMSTVITWFSSHNQNHSYSFLIWDSVCVSEWDSMKSQPWCCYMMNKYNLITMMDLILYKNRPCLIFMVLQLSDNKNRKINHCQ